jgi:uncharacterized protein (TIGR02271 family)
VRSGAAATGASAASKSPEQAGEVTVGKELVTERREIDVPLKRQEVVVERRPAQGTPTSGEIREGEEVRMTVMEERVEVESGPSSLKK